MVKVTSCHFYVYPATVEVQVRRTINISVWSATYYIIIIR